MPEITLDSEDQFNLNPPSSFEDPPDVLPLFVTSKNPGYKKWTLTRDPSIDEDRDNHICTLQTNIRASLEIYLARS